MDSEPAPESIAETTSETYELESDKQSQPRQFGATWDVSDSAHLLPTLSLKHIPRAWERKPQSPVVKQRSSRKIWHRHDFPQSLSNTTVSSSRTKNLQNPQIARLKKAFVASHSPKKITKKRCVHTAVGQTASANQWDQKASTPLRMSSFSLTPPCLHATAHLYLPVTVQPRFQYCLLST